MLSVLRLLRSVSLPRLWEHPLRTALTVVGIGLGVAVLVAVVLVQRSIMASVESSIDDISGKADWQVSAGPSGIDEALISTIKATPGVFKATPVMQKSVRIAATALDPKRREALDGQALVLLGAEFLDQDDEYFRPYGSHEIDAIRLDPIAFLNSKSNLIISKKFADQYGFKERDTIPLLTPDGILNFTIWGFIPENRIGRAVGGSLGVMYYQAMQAAFRRGSSVDRFDVAVVKGEDAEVVRGRLLGALGPGFAVDRPERRAGRIAYMLGGFRYALTGGSMIALLVGLFLIFNTVAIGVVQRKTEIGILRSLGSTRRQIMGLFVSEGLLMGILGTLWGSFFGLYLARYLLAATTEGFNEVYLRIEANTVVLDGWLIAAAIAVGLGGTLLSTLGPARTATRVTPIETIRAPGQIMPTKPGAWRWRYDVLGVAILLLAAFLARLPAVFDGPYFGLAACFALPVGGAFLMPRLIAVLQRVLAPVCDAWFGAEGQLANANVTRDIGRAAITTAALMIATSMVLAFAIYVFSFQASLRRWIEQSVPADLFITSAHRISGSLNVPLNEGLLPYFKGLPGVESVDCVRFTDLDHQDRTLKVLSVDWEVHSRHATADYVQGDRTSAGPKIRDGRGVVVSENMAGRWGYDLGTTITLTTPKGPRDFEVVGVVVDYTSDQGVIFINRPIYKALWQDDLVDTYELYLHPGADLEKLRHQINAEQGERYELFVLSNAEFRDELLELVKRVFQVVDALKLAALTIALLGVLNTMLANVLDRFRELGVLRAIGALRRQVRKLVMLEAAILGLASICAGVLTGFALGLVLVESINSAQAGWRFPFTVPVQDTLELCAFVLTVCVLAAYYPARRAAAIRVRDALGYE